MKNLFLFTFLLLSIFAKGQTPCGDSSGNWHLERGNSSLSIIYDVIDTAKSVNSTDSAISADSILFKKMVIGFIKGLGHVENIAANSQPFTFDIKGIKIDYKKYGYRLIELLFLNAPMDCKCLIEFKENKYRITFKDFIFHEKIVLSSQIVDRDSYLNDMMFNNEGCLRKMYINRCKNTLNVIERYLTDYFKYTTPAKPKKSDW